MLKVQVLLGGAIHRASVTVFSRFEMGASAGGEDGTHAVKHAARGRDTSRL